MVMSLNRVLTVEWKDVDSSERCFDRVSRAWHMIGYEGEGRNRNQG